MKWLTTLLIAASLPLGAPVAARDVTDDTGLAPFFEPLNRMSVGLASTFSVSDRFGIQLGGTWSQKGGSLDILGIMRMIANTMTIPEGVDVTSELEGLALEADIEMDYIELTALAEIRLPLSGDRASVHLLAGPTLGFQSSCRLSVSGSEGTASLEQNEDCDAGGFDSKDFDFGLAGGGGIEIALTDKLNARVDMLYTLGLLDISDDASEIMKHRALTLRAGLGIPIG